MDREFWINSTSTILWIAPNHQFTKSSKGPYICGAQLILYNCRGVTTWNCSVGIIYNYFPQTPTFSPITNQATIHIINGILKGKKITPHNLCLEFQYLPANFRITSISPFSLNPLVQLSPFMQFQWPHFWRKWWNCCNAKIRREVLEF